MGIFGGGSPLGGIAKIAQLPVVDQLTDAWAMSVAGPFGPGLKDMALGIAQGQDPMEALKSAGMGMLQSQLGGFGGQIMSQLGVTDASAIPGFDDFFSVAQGQLPTLTEEQGLGLLGTILQVENGEMPGQALSPELLSQLGSGDTGSAILKLTELLNLGRNGGNILTSGSGIIGTPPFVPPSIG